MSSEDVHVRSTRELNVQVQVQALHYIVHVHVIFRYISPSLPSLTVHVHAILIN